MSIIWHKGRLSGSGNVLFLYLEDCYVWYILLVFVNIHQAVQLRFVCFIHISDSIIKIYFKTFLGWYVIYTMIHLLAWILKFINSIVKNVIFWILIETITCKLTYLQNIYRWKALESFISTPKLHKRAKGILKNYRVNFLQLELETSSLDNILFWCI